MKQFFLGITSTLDPAADASDPADAPDTADASGPDSADAPEPAPADAPETADAPESAPADAPETADAPESAPADAPETADAPDPADAPEPADAPDTARPSGNIRDVDTAVDTAVGFGASGVEARVVAGMVAAARAQHTLWRASAELFRTIDDTLIEAVTHPKVFLRPQQSSTRQPGSQLSVPRLSKSQQPGCRQFSRDDLQFAERAAAADLAVRLSLAETTVRNHGMIAHTLRHRMPSFWAKYDEGELSTQNAREAAVLAAELSEEFWPEFESTMMAASHLTPARFRVRARAVCEKLEARTLTDRHRAARAFRRVWSEIDRDGMGWLHAHLPAENLAQVTANLDGIAFRLFSDTEETRTMAQLRADVLSDLITGPTDPHAGTTDYTRYCNDADCAGCVGCTDSAGRGTDWAGLTGAIEARADNIGCSCPSTTRRRPAVGVTVALTIPVLTLLGHGTDPAVLEGVGPIDSDTARRLTATAPTITRLLTDPVTGTILSMDPHQYRIPAVLRRWLAIQQVTCDFPGCGRPAKNCDLDHTHAWSDGGTTTAANLAHRCRKHHMMKHHTKWQVHKPRGSDRPVWTSPTGYSREADPAPF